MKTQMFKAMLLGFVLFGLAIIGAYHYAGQQAPDIANKTTAIDVISVTPAADGYDLRLRNASQKNINGYSIGYESAYRTSDLTVGEDVVPPGEEFTVQLPQIWAPPGADAAKKSMKAPPLAIRYVIFDDDSSDGDGNGAQELRDIRTGRREQLERIGFLLNTMAAAPNITQLESQLQELPSDGLKTDRSFNVARGRLAAKQDILMELSKLDKDNPRVELLKLRDQNARHLMRLTRRDTP